MLTMNYLKYIYKRKVNIVEKIFNLYLLLSIQFKDYIESNDIVTKTNATRLGGINRFATNKLVVEKFYPNTNEFCISKGYVLVDALTVSPFAKNYPVVLAHQGSDKSIVENATKLIQVGGMDKVIINGCISQIK